MFDKALNWTAFLAIALILVGFVAGFTSYYNSLGILFPVGLTIFYAVGLIANWRSKRDV